jgi:hypothetical protein
VNAYNRHAWHPQSYFALALKFQGFFVFFGGTRIAYLTLCDQNPLVFRRRCAMRNLANTQLADAGISKPYRVLSCVIFVFSSFGCDYGEQDSDQTRNADSLSSQIFRLPVTLEKSVCVSSACSNTNPAGLQVSRRLIAGNNTYEDHFAYLFFSAERLQRDTNLINQIYQYNKEDLRDAISKATLVVPIETNTSTKNTNKIDVQPAFPGETASLRSTIEKLSSANENEINAAEKYMFSALATPVKSDNSNELRYDASIAVSDGLYSIYNSENPPDAKQHGITIRFASKDSVVFADEQMASNLPDTHLVLKKGEAYIEYQFATNDACRSREAAKNPRMMKAAVQVTDLFRNMEPGSGEHTQLAFNLVLENRGKSSIANIRIREARWVVVRGCQSYAISDGGRAIQIPASGPNAWSQPTLAPGEKKKKTVLVEANIPSSDLSDIPPTDCFSSDCKAQIGVRITYDCGTSTDCGSIYVISAPQTLDVAA